MNKTVFYARSSSPNQATPTWQLLSDHLTNAAELAESFAEAFGSSDWGQLAGLWHDIGKYRQEFQQKLRGANVSVDHSGAGAALARERDDKLGLFLALAIAGHHSGLANIVSTECGPKPLKQRLRENIPVLEAIRSDLPNEIAERPVPDLPAFLWRAPKGRPDIQMERRRRAFWTRFLFSALVDADRLNSEAFADPTVAATRSRYADIADLKNRLDACINDKVANLSAEAREREVNKARSEVLRACRSAAEDRPGIFSLTVPTGGGKTLSSMSFALRHTKHHGLRRIIVVIPYTSIIEQNAEEYRNALGAENVIEHHSNLNPETREARYGDDLVRRHELACENWDAPVVVTTTVQFFESLFSNHPSRCRKLHNIARSVVILDEVQTLPEQFLVPIVDALNELVSNYGCSIVLSTATPPALAARNSFPAGLRNVRPIITAPLALFQRLSRVSYTWPAADDKPAGWDELAAELADEPQVLVVVHRRKDARELATQLGARTDNDSAVHLSALMCPAHRSAVLKQVNATLLTGAPCRLVSTQLIEAGVDIDFPVVYRALAGLDSVVQAAGRCNREGRLARGRVVVYRAPT